MSLLSVTESVEGEGGTVKGMAKMKVALVCPYPVGRFAARLEIAPLGRHTYPSSNVSLVSGLAKLEDIELHVVSLVRGLKKDYRLSESGVIFHFLKDPRFSGLATGFQWQKRIIHHCLARIQPDVVHGIGTETSCAYAAVTAGIPNVITLRGIIREMLKHAGWQGLQLTWRIRSWFERYTLQRASHVICISPYVKDVLQAIYDKPEYYSIDNAVDESFFAVYPKSEAGVKNLLFVGSINPGKGVIDAVRAMVKVAKTIPNAQLSIVGSPSNHPYYQQVLAFVQSHNLGDSVKFLGWRDHEELPHLLSRTDLLVFPSYLETFGNVVAESMAAGVPVVAANTSAIPHLVTDGVTGFLVEPGDIVDLENRIITILEDKQLKANMGRNAKEVALRRWHPNVIAKKTYDVYKRILKSK